MERMLRSRLWKYVARRFYNGDCELRTSDDVVMGRVTVGELELLALLADRPPNVPVAWVSEWLLARLRSRPGMEALGVPPEKVHVEVGNDGCLTFLLCSERE